MPIGHFDRQAMASAIIHADTLDATEDVMLRIDALVQREVAAERERIAQVVRDFQHWIGPHAKRELLMAIGVWPNAQVQRLPAG